MTLAVKDLIDLGFQYYDLRRMDIRCAVDNVKKPQHSRTVRL